MILELIGVVLSFFAGFALGYRQKVNTTRLKAQIEVKKALIEIGLRELFRRV